MIFTSILKKIVAKALPSYITQNLIFYLKGISVIIFKYIRVFIFRINTLYIQSIGSDINIYNGLFHFIHFSKVSIPKNKITQYLIKSIDLLILLIVTAYLINDFISCYIYSINNIYNFFNFDVICNMANTTQTQTTEIKIIHDDGSWSNAIRSLFIYGSGALRLNLIRTGTPGSKAFIIASTVATDSISKFINNSINNPEYIKAHYNSWKYIWENNTEGVANITVDNETADRLNRALLSNNFTSDGMDDITEKIVSSIMKIVGPILETVPFNYSNEVLATHIHHLAVLLFIFSLLISILIFTLLFNVFILINSERILKFFKNKYIRWYVNINIKFIAIELFLLGGSILFFMFDLSKGLHFIATHPLILS